MRSPLDNKNVRYVVPLYGCSRMEFLRSLMPAHWNAETDLEDSTVKGRKGLLVETPSYLA